MPPSDIRLTRPLSAVSLHERLLEVLDRADLAAKGPRCLPNMRAGLDVLDACLEKKRLVALIGPPSIGKTALALRIARETAHIGHVLYCSALGEGNALALRLLSAASRIPCGRIGAGRLDADEWARLTEVSNDLGSTPLWLSDTPAERLGEVRAGAMRHRDELGLDLLILDGVRASADALWPALEELAVHVHCSVLAVCETDLSWSGHEDARSIPRHVPVILLRNDPEQPPLERSDEQRWVQVSVSEAGETCCELRVCVEKLFGYVEPA